MLKSFQNRGFRTFLQAQPNHEFLSPERAAWNSTLLVGFVGQKLFCFGQQYVSADVPKWQPSDSLGTQFCVL